MGSRNRAETAQPAEEDREFRRSARPRPRPLLPPRITPAPTHPPTAGIRSYRRYLPLLPHQRRPRPPASRPAPRRGALFCKIRARAHRGGDCMHRRFSEGVHPAAARQRFAQLLERRHGNAVRLSAPKFDRFEPDRLDFFCIQLPGDALPPLSPRCCAQGEI